jgi:hypothetical protein
MKALRDIRQCQKRLASILQMGMWDPIFDDTRHKMQTSLDTFCDSLTHIVTYTNWWSLLEDKIKAQQRSERGSAPDNPPQRKESANQEVRSP